jgi:hypothetical protein
MRRDQFATGEAALEFHPLTGLFDELVADTRADARRQ